MRRAFWLVAAVLSVLLSQWERKGAVAQFTTACLTNNTRTDDDGQPTETNADCQPAVLPRGEIAAACEANALLPIVDNITLGNFGQCFYENTTRRLLKEQQTDALNNEDSDTFGNVTATSGNQSIICGEPSGVNGTNITDLGTAALGSCPSDKPICARTSDSRFCYCIEEEVGLFGDVANFSRGDVSLTRGVASGQPSSLCFPAELDPCFNAVNRFAVPFDCAGSLPVVERREDIGPNPREQSVKPNEEPPVPQEATFAQLVPGTYLFEDVSSDAYLPTVNNTGANVSSCMRIQGKSDDDNGLGDFFVDLSCNTTEGVSVTLQFTCPDTGLCSNRAGNALQPAVATVQGVLVVENASNPVCEGIEAQIEVTLTGFVDESESLIAQQFEYNQTQRILIIGNETQDDLVTARAIGILSPSANTSLGLLTFPDDVPDECDVLLNQRAFSVTSGETEAGGILALAASGYGRDTTSGEIIRKNPLEASQFAFDNQDAFRECSEICVSAADMSEDSVTEVRPEQAGTSVILREDFSRALLGEVLPTIFSPLYKPEQSPDLSFSSAAIGDRFFVITDDDVSCLDDLDLDVKFPVGNKSVLCSNVSDTKGPRSFDLFSAETGVSLDLILKGQLGNLIDGREVLANCRGLRLPNLPVDFEPGDDGLSAQALVDPSLTGEVVSVALAPNEGLLGADTCVFVFPDGNHTCKGITRGSEQRINASVEMFSTREDPTINNCTERFSDFAMGDGDVLPNRCVIGFECFEACPEIVLNASSTAQPSSYRMTDFKPRVDPDSTAADLPAEDVNDTGVDPNSTACLWIFRARGERGSGTEAFVQAFSCEGDDADLQVRIRYDVEALDGRIALRAPGDDDQPQVGFANVDFKGTVRQVSPEECEGTLMFVEGTLAGGLSFEPQGEEGSYPALTSYLPTIRDFFNRAGTNDTKSITPELIFTSSAPVGTMQYSIISPPSNTSAESCLLPPKTLTYRKNGTALVKLEDGEFVNASLFSFPLLSVDNADSEDNTTFVDSWFRMYTRQGRGGIDFQSRVSGHLREVCDIPKEGVQIQCLARRPFVLRADEDFLKPDDAFLTSVARVQTQYGIDPAGLPLQSPPDFNLNCSRDDVERVKQALDGRRVGYIVRTIPLFVEAPTDDGKTRIVEQLCPVLTSCVPMAETDTPASAGQT
ncbi:unnamed protein product [Vitrella brassicaformis CCMP3155]|uniref:Uncharacterized protein n=1 Tax=Vitrella brassicaformis (strain CCMP3155) TaxID=1169540 RepID=A0A0G4EK79_VITBC|nr:unnamed protein product [Vitrella brassicaformis CCMP3155]|eukprot:CEL97850.1 unnamed protein product [Vitrella brassicaformis CCMP3155]